MACRSTMRNDKPSLRDLSTLNLAKITAQICRYGPFAYFSVYRRYSLSRILGPQVQQSQVHDPSGDLQPRLTTRSILCSLDPPPRRPTRLRNRQAQNDKFRLSIVCQAHLERQTLCVVTFAFLMEMCPQVFSIVGSNGLLFPKILLACSLHGDLSSFELLAEPKGRSRYY